MAALDFPDSPSNGDEFSGYVYDSAKGVWNRLPTLPALDLVAFSATAPSSPQDGQFWFDTTSSKMYVYYNDGSSSQWVSTIGGFNELNAIDDVVISSATAGQALTYDGTNWVNSPGGLVHISTVDFSAVALQRLNNVFTSSYDVYEIVINNVTASDFVSIAFRLSSGGTDNTTASSYTRQRILSTAPSTLNTATFSGDGYFSNDADTTAPTSMKYTVYGPALAQATGILHQAFVNASSDVLIVTGGYHSVTSAYDGFSLTPSSGTFSGTVSVYGYGRS